MKTIIFLLCCFCGALWAEPKVELGVDVFFQEAGFKALKGKKIGLITNHTGVNRDMRSTVSLFKSHGKELKLAALFAPEHGLTGALHAGANVEDGKDKDGIPIYSLHGKNRRPTDEMLKGIDVLVYDIQDIGSRSYTFATTLFYAMEEAAKKNIKVIVFDRPNPISGVLVDGPMMEEKWRSFIGYLNIPYCHGMTIGELALFFNEEYQIGCDLQVISMNGWKRTMNFKETGLSWIPTSPHIPESDSPLFYATTGILGELDIVNIGVGYTLPFKVVGAPWIKANEFAEKLNNQKLPGVYFVPFHYRPFYGTFKGDDCQGVLICVTNRFQFRPLAVQYLLIGMLKNLYPKQIADKLSALEQGRKKLFCQANGNEEMLALIHNEKYVVWKLIQFQKEERQEFLSIRKKYLLY